ncbi:baeRF12 domain-containing protein [Ruegeria arenilitoris]|uniref:baeRF12 domain-containing protein n=1 Tax=Ruegeria arenilitoris TaxID=1173585 RepID=UPI00147C8C9D
MSKILRVPEDVVVLVCDSKKALLLKNTGAVAQPVLQIEKSIERPKHAGEVGNPDRPGRRFDGGAAAVSGSSRSAMEATDVEAKRAEAFAVSIVSALGERHRKNPIGGLIIAAPPNFLGILRQNMDHDLRQLIRDEVAKELAEMPLSEIQKGLLNSL